ncbi:tectonic-2 isoform X2 [Procambarus clarkii]|uniref:tectonic-2 isoform X2 n=1 Tax=Procambarus clarkii TaxID=6728 RepID=UPI003741ECC0
MGLAVSPFMEYFIIISAVHGEYIAVNWTEVGSRGSTTESHLEDPAVKPLAPCPCDLTSNFCDPHCCCDKDCSLRDKKSFTCLEGLNGGHSTDKILDNNCKYQGPYSPEWHDFLCFVTENNPYLGLFYKPEPSIQDFQKYLSRVKSDAYSYRHTTAHPQDQERFPYYVLGSSVETAILTNFTIFKNILSLPQQILNGLCVKTIPIHFLEDFAHVCSLAVSPEVCKTEPLLSAATFLHKADGIIRDPYVGHLHVIGNLAALQMADVFVEYECLWDTNNFIKVQGLNKFVNKGSSQFWTERYNSETCSGNNVPFYNETSQMCENVVLSVEYNIGWRGPSIVEVHAKVTLGDVAVTFERLLGKYSSEIDRESFLYKNTVSKLESALSKRRKFITPSRSLKLSLLQHFSASFYHMGSSSTSNETTELFRKLDSNKINITDDFEYESRISERSGNPGYEVGKPVIGGYAMYNMSTYEDNTTCKNFISVEVSNTTGLYIWKPDASGGCKESLDEVVSFKVDMISSCTYFWRNINSCSDLRDTHGNRIESNSPDCQVPFSLEYKILYQDTTDVTKTTLSVYQIIGTYIRFHYKGIKLFTNKGEGSISLTTSVTFLNCPRAPKLSRFWEAMQDHWCSGGICWHEILQPWTHGNTEGGGPTARDYHITYIMNLVANSAMILFVILPLIVLALLHTHQLKL